MRLIGLHGPARSGKDTIARILCTTHGFSQLAFAEPIKDMLMVGFGLVRDQVDGPGKETVIDWIGKSPRELMQTLGTEWGREMISPGIWAEHAGRRLKLYRSWAKGVVISDVRFEEEAGWVRYQGGEVWHITGRDGSGRVRMHASESGIARAPGDIVLDNSGRLEYLAHHVNVALCGVGEVMRWTRSA